MLRLISHLLIILFNFWEVKEFIIMQNNCYTNTVSTFRDEFYQSLIPDEPEIHSHSHSY